jgi:hypothetical protein
MEATGDDRLWVTLKVDVVSLEYVCPAIFASQSADTGELLSAVEGSEVGRVVEVMIGVDTTGRPSVGSPGATEGVSSDSCKPLYSHPGRSQTSKRSVKSSSRSSYDSKCSGGGGDLSDCALWFEGYRKIWSARRQCVLARSRLVELEGRRWVDHRQIGCNRLRESRRLPC